MADARMNRVVIESLRPRATRSETESLEKEWWHNFAELEEKYAWVQPDSVRRVLRQHYVKKIVRHVELNDPIVELGCGTGWLCRDLAHAGATKVVGLDFSEAQIQIAKLRAKEEGLQQRVSFFVSNETTLIEALSPKTVLIHGFLHHLDKSQIKTIISRIAGFLQEGGRLLIFEPVLHSIAREPSLQTRILQRLLDLLERIPQWGQRFGLRQISPEEASVRQRFAKRSVGLWPHGPSPKEIPFAPGELDLYLNGKFSKIEHEPVMVRSHLVMQEWLLRSLSHPTSSRILIPMVSRLASRLDRWVAAAQVPPQGWWVFTLFNCSV